MGENKEENSDRGQLIRDVVSIEWGMFQEVQNVGGRADCQSMPQTFFVMRASQFDSWPDEIIESYKQDLNDALNEQRNPVSEKYAYMMKSTHPGEYDQIRQYLPEISKDKHDLVEDIIKIELTWADELSAKYPHFTSQGRPTRTSQDTPCTTSIETYARGELSTYSVRTLRMLLDHYTKLAAKGVNLQAKVAAKEASAYGYKSLDEAERVIAEGKMSGNGLDPDPKYATEDGPYDL
jgi:hypothetical protein